jgi:hypothetical protein
MSFGPYCFQQEETRRRGLGTREYAGMTEQDREEFSCDGMKMSSWESLPLRTEEDTQVIF